MRKYLGRIKSIFFFSVVTFFFIGCASLEVADTPWARTRGLLGRDHVEGALLIEPCRSVHTLAMRVSLDVAWRDRSGRVVRMARLDPNRISRPVRSARSVIEAEAGAFARWGLGVGDRLDVHR